MLLAIQARRRDSDGNLIVSVLNGRGGAEEMRLSASDALEVERVWALSQSDLDRYASLPDCFPAPAAIPVDVSDPPA